ncbi:MAG: hypothetical protein QXP80_02895 [Zestosphaera sp.]
MGGVRVLCGEKKHAGGKLVKVCLKIQGDLVKGVFITGDFFVEPEEEFIKLTYLLSVLEAPIHNVADEVTRVLEEGKDVRIYGVTIEDVREAIYTAVTRI